NVLRRRDSRVLRSYPDTLLGATVATRPPRLRPPADRRPGRPGRPRQRLRPGRRPLVRGQPGLAGGGLCPARRPLLRRCARPDPQAAERPGPAPAPPGPAAVPPPGPPAPPRPA